MTYPAIICWALIVWSITASRGTLLMLLLASMPFVSLAVLPVSIGMSILPQSMFAVVLILKVFAPEVFPLSPKLVTGLRLRNLGYLAAFSTGRHCNDVDHAKVLSRTSRHRADAKRDWS